MIRMGRRAFRAVPRKRRMPTGDRFIEIWNLVFMQYEQRAPGDRITAEAVDRHRHGA